MLPKSLPKATWSATTHYEKGVPGKDLVIDSTPEKCVVSFRYRFEEELLMALPFMNAYGLVTKILDKIIEAPQPDRLTVDFLSNKLGHGSGSARPIISLLKKLNFITSDGTPTALYGRFRNPDTRGAAMAEGLRNAYKDLYDRSEYAHDLDKDKLRNMVMEITGAEKGDPSIGSIVNTFTNLRAYAKSDGGKPPDGNKGVVVIKNDENPPPPPPPSQNTSGLNLSYTINLNLPETSDVEVFNAIFRSLK
jgi:hypothetical protein